MNIANEIIHIEQPAEPKIYTPDIFKTIKNDPKQEEVKTTIPGTGEKPDIKII